MLEIRYGRPEMPFADQRCLITDVVQRPGVCPQSCRDRLAECPYAVGVAVQARQNRCPAGGTNGVAAEAVNEQAPLAGEPVDVWSNGVLPAKFGKARVSGTGSGFFNWKSTLDIREGGGATGRAASDLLW